MTVTEHHATLKTKRSRAIRRLDVTVRCSCGDGRTFVVFPCSGRDVACSGVHVHAVLACSKVVMPPPVCPALVAAMRGLDRSLDRATAEGFLGAAGR